MINQKIKLPTPHLWIFGNQNIIFTKQALHSRDIRKVRHMKSIPKIMLFAVILSGVISCEPRPTVKYAHVLEDCMSTSEVSLLNSLCQSFETHIINTYNQSPSESYNQYLINLADGDFPQNFFQYPSFEDDMTLFYNSDFHQSQWVKTSSFKEQITPAVPDSKVLDPTGKYVQCLVRQNSVQAMTDYLEIVKAGLDVSPRLVAGALKDELSAEDLNSALTRLVIAINFHYQIGLYVAGKK